MHYPLAKYSEDPVVTCPLTKDELWVLGKFWAETSLDASVFCRLWGQVGSTDLRLWKYTSDRLSRIAEILGEAEVEKIHNEVEAIVRERLGDEDWQAFLERRPVFLERLEEQEKSALKNEV